MRNAKISKEEIIYAIKMTIPVMTGYEVLGMGFGVILSTKGYGVLWALGMSLFIFAGSMQYVAIDLLTAGASLITVAITTLAVNARHLFYGLTMVERYNTAPRKPFLIFGLTDETYSLVCSEHSGEETGNRENYWFLVTLFDYLYWVSGSVIGNLLGSIIPFNTEGIDFALTALFLVIVTEQWLSTKNHISVFVGIISSVVCLVLFGSDSFLIPAMICIAVMLTLLRNKEGITNE